MEDVAVADGVVEKEVSQNEVAQEAGTDILDEEAFNADMTLKSNMLNRTYAFIHCCLNLKLIKCRRFYKAHADSWNEYVASVGLTKAKADRMVKLALIIEAFSLQTEMAPSFGSIDEERLIKDWMPLVKYDKGTNLIENVDESLEFLEQAKVLSYSDFQSVIDQHKQSGKHPEGEFTLEEGPVFDEHNNVIGNYRNIRSTNTVRYYSIGILDRCIKGREGQELKVNLGKIKDGEIDKDDSLACAEYA